MTCDTVLVLSMGLPALQEYWCRKSDECLGVHPRHTQEPLVVRDRAGRLPRGPLAFCVCVAVVRCWEIMG